MKCVPSAFARCDRSWNNTACTGVWLQYTATISAEDTIQLVSLVIITKPSLTFIKPVRTPSTVVYVEHLAYRVQFQVSQNS